MDDQSPELINLSLEVLEVNPRAREAINRRWEASGKPSLRNFAPYAAHVFSVDALYYLGINRGFISAGRASNKADMAYLYYLPFTMIFVSGDKLHARTVPLFLRDDQSYVDAADFKKALAELDAHYDALPQEVKERGVMQFAHYPPSDLDNVVVQLWDKHFGTDWRTPDTGSGVAPERDSPHDSEVVKQIQESMKTATAMPQAEASKIKSDITDQMIIQRRVPVKKGKWRMVSREVEEADKRSQ